MKEFIAIAVCFMVASILVLISYLFAAREDAAVLPSRTPASNLPVVAETHTATSSSDRGKMVFQQQGCLSCHSLNGNGNPRHPLDGVANRLSADQLRDGITGSGSVGERFPSAIRKRKASYLKLTDADMAQLIHYLSSAGSTTNSLSP